MNKFDPISAIIERHSVRTFSPSRRLSDEQVKVIGEYAAAAANPFGLNEMCIGMIKKSTGASGEKLGTYGIIKNADTFLALQCKNDMMQCVAAAYAMETVVLWLTSQGLSSVWIGGTFNRGAFAQAATLCPGMIMPVVIPIGYAADKLRLMERLMRKVAKSDSRKSWDELFFYRSPTHPLSEEEAGLYAKPLEMVRLAPSAVNAQPWRVILSDGSAHFYADYKSSLSGQNLVMKFMDMGIALCHFGLTCKWLGIRGHFVAAGTDASNTPAIKVADSWHYVASWIV